MRAKCNLQFPCFDFVFSVLVKRLARKNISRMTYLCRVGCKTLTSKLEITTGPVVHEGLLEYFSNFG